MYKLDPTDGLITSLNANALKLDSATAVIEVQNKKDNQELQIPTAQDVATKAHADGSTVIGVQLDITGLGANAGNNYAPVGVLLEKLFLAGGYDPNKSNPFRNGT